MTKAKGIAIGHGAQANVTEVGAEIGDIARVFAPIVQRVDAMPEGANKDDAKDAIKKLEAEARKGDQTDESRVQRWFNFLAETAPDAFQVAVDTFTHPIKGISTVFQRIAERAKAERETKAKLDQEAKKQLVQ